MSFSQTFRRSNPPSKLVQKRWMTGDRFSMEIGEFLSRQRQTLLSRASVETTTAREARWIGGRVYQSFKMVQQNWKIVLYFRERRAGMRQEHVSTDKYLYRVDGFVYKWQLFRIRAIYTRSRWGKVGIEVFTLKKNSLYISFAGNKT